MCEADAKASGDRAAANEAPSVALSAIGLLSPKNFVALVVENAQSDRSRRKSDIRGGDDRRRCVRRLNLDFRQSYRTMLWRRTNKLDPERARRRGDEARWFLYRRWLGKGSRLVRRVLFAIGNENGIHC